MSNYRRRNVCHSDRVLQKTAVDRIVFSPNDSQRRGMIQRISRKEQGDHSGKDSIRIDAVFGRALHLLSTLPSGGIVPRVIFGEVVEERQPPHWGYVKMRSDEELAGGGEGNQPSLTPLLRFEIQGVAFAA